MEFRRGLKSNIFQLPVWTALILIFIFPLLFSSSAFSQRVPNLKYQAYQLITKEDYISAIKLINKGLEFEPSSADLYLLRGFARYGLDDLLGAESDYSMSVAISPYNIEAFNYRGIVRTQLQYYEGAFNDFAAALAIDSSRSDILLNRARTYLAVKKYYSCITDCNEAIRLKIQGESVYMLRGIAKMALKRYEEAMEDMNEAIRLNPGNPYTYTQRALIYMEQENPDSAVADFNRAILADSNNTYVLFNRALAYSKKKEHDNARADLDKVIRLSPYNAYAYYNRAIEWIELDNKKKAIADFAMVSRLDPRNIISYYYGSRLKYELKMYREALADLDKTLELYPEYMDALHDRYLVKLKLNDRKGALEDMKKLEESGKKNEVTPDSVRSNKESYLKSLMKLSGDFEEMNTLNSKFQNQQVEIELMPMFRPVTGKTSPGRGRIYDAYKKPYYYTHFIFLTDSAVSYADTILSHRLDSLLSLDGLGPEGNYLAAAAYAESGQYDSAIKHYNKCLATDPEFIMAYFGRAVSRFQLLEKYQKEISEDEPVTIMNQPAEKHHPAPSEPIHTLDEVYNDLSEVIRLDPDFQYAFYDRAFICSKLGRYQDAVNDYSSALKNDLNLPGAWYGKGLLNILLKNNPAGCQDLSKAGELGIMNAFRVMKRYCFKN